MAGIKRKIGDCTVEGCGAKGVYLGRVSPAECIRCYKRKKAEIYAERERERKKAKIEAIKAGEIEKPKINKISKKQKKLLQIYERERDEYMAAHEVCEVKGCGSPANDLHHKAGRVGSLLYDKDYFMAVCRGCHDYIHDYPKEAEKKGYIIRVRNILNKK